MMKFRSLIVAYIILMVVHQTFAQEALQVVQIKVLPGLQFDVVRFHVKPGSKVKLVFTNTDEMEHNLLITKPGAREEVVAAALSLGSEGPAKNYIPEIPQVLWTIPVIRADQTASVTFVAPKDEGVYPYVCTFPGHGFVMYGAMYVSSDGKMPALSEDVNIPPNRRTSKSSKPLTKENSNHSNHDIAGAVEHPYSSDIPNLYRVYIDGASPAAIVVRLTDNLSYCWDAGVSKLRFAWKGGFVDNSALWKGHKDAEAKILGEVFYRDKGSFPIRINDEYTIPKVEYKGYRFINKVPEFHYTVNGVDVFELISPSENGNGLIRKFKILKSNSTVYFMYDHRDNMNYQIDTGTQHAGKFELSPEQAKEFSITMIKKNEK